MNQRVMIVDDSRTARMFIRQCLEVAGCHGWGFVEAANGREALEHLKHDALFDFIVSDLNMPVMDGLELLQHLHQDPELSRVPVMVVSSLQNAARDKELMELGAKAVMPKPVTPAAVAAQLKIMLP